MFENISDTMMGRGKKGGGVNLDIVAAAIAYSNRNKKNSGGLGLGGYGSGLGGYGLGLGLVYSVIAAAPEQ